MGTYFMKRLIIVILAALCSFFKPVAADVATDASSIRDRLYFLVDLSDLKKNEKNKLYKKIDALNVVLEDNFDAREAISDYLEHFVPGNYLYSSPYLSVGYPIGFTCLSTGLLLGYLGWASIMTVVTLFGYIHGLLFGALWLATNILCWTIFGIHNLIVYLSSGSRLRKTQKEFPLYLDRLRKSSFAVPDQLASFHLNYMTQKENVLEKVLKSGSLVKDLVAALG